MSFKVTLRRIRRLSASTMDFRFERDDSEPVEFEPGQFFRFVFEDEQGEFERSYSLCNFGDAVSGSTYLDLVISEVEGGRATNLLFNAEEGLTASVTGPYGRLVLPKEMPRRLIMVATSVGIAPYMPMLSRLRSIFETNPVEVYFLFGARNPDEFIYREALTRFDEDNPQFHLLMCYSREMPAQPKTFERKGYVQEALDELSPDPVTDYVLLCGNPGMIDDVFDKLKSRGFTGKQVVREKYVFARETGATKVKEMSAAQKKLLAEKMKKYQSGE